MEKVGRYELLGELGKGGMARVYLARLRGPAGFHRFFALKRIHRELAGDPHFVRMFLDEARIAASLHHPNVAQVFELFAEENEYCLVMEYLHGEPLVALAKQVFPTKGHLPDETMAYVIAETAGALQHAHEAKDPSGEWLQIIHRDVSPHNIFLSYEGQVKLTDFGIAKAINRLTKTQTGGGIKGKTAYLAPEQVHGKGFDARVDIYALGIVLWEMSVGKRLFRADTDVETLTRIMESRVPEPRSMRPDYPPELERITLKALARDPHDRYQRAGDMRADLLGWLETLPARVGANGLLELMQTCFVHERDRKSSWLAEVTGSGEVAARLIGTPTSRMSSIPPGEEMKRTLPERPSSRVTSRPSEDGYQTLPEPHQARAMGHPSAEENVTRDLGGDGASPAPRDHPGFATTPDLTAAPAAPDAPHPFTEGNTAKITGSDDGTPRVATPPPSAQDDVPDANAYDHDDTDSATIVTAPTSFSSDPPPPDDVPPPIDDGDDDGKTAVGYLGGPIEERAVSAERIARRSSGPPPPGPATGAPPSERPRRGPPERDRTTASRPTAPRQRERASAGEHRAIRVDDEDLTPKRTTTPGGIARYLALVLLVIAVGLALGLAMR